MTEKIDRPLAKKVARLARLSVEESSLDEVAQQMSQIIGFVDQLSLVQLPDDLTPFFGADEADSAIRDDIIVASYDREIILQNAPDSDGQHYQVPPVF